MMFIFNQTKTMFSKIIIFLLAFIFCPLITSAQKYTAGSISLTKESHQEGKIAIDSEKQIVLLKNNEGTSEHSFEQIDNAMLDGRLFELKTIGNKTYLAHALVIGKASLFQIEAKKYIVYKANDFYKVIDLNTKLNELNEHPDLIKGTLAAFFDDCNSIRDGIFRQEKFTETVLIGLTNDYNVCSYSVYEPTATEIATSNSVNADAIRFYGGPLWALKNVSFFDDNSTEIVNQFGFTIGVEGTPNFVGPLQENLYFNFQLSLSFAGEKDFSNAPSPTSFSVNTYRMILGVEYYVNKNGKVKPFLGIGGGLTSDSYEGNVDGAPFDIKGGNPIWMPKAGLLFRLNNGKNVGLAVEYVPEYDNDLSFPYGDEYIPLMVNSSYLNFSLNYYF